MLEANVNTGRATVNFFRQNVNSVRSNVNTGSFNINTGRSKQPVPTKLENYKGPQADPKPVKGLDPKEKLILLFSCPDHLLKTWRTKLRDEAKNARRKELKRQDELAAKRLQEELELSEAQKKRMAQVQEAAQFYTEEDWDTIRAKLEANADLVKEIAGEDVSEADYAQRMRKKLGKRTGVELQTESSKKLKSNTREDVSIPKEKDKEPKGLAEKPESAKGPDTKEDVESQHGGKGWMNQSSKRVSNEFNSTRTPAPVKKVKWQMLKNGKKDAYQIHQGR
ncbi:hypothetical protein Tco_0109282 [Tanacetum coccineum]